MGVDRRQQGRERGAGSVHRYHRAGQKVGAVSGEDVRSEDLAGATVEHELDSPAAVSQRARLARLADVVAADLDLVAGRERLLLAESDTGELGAGEDRPRDDAVIRSNLRVVEHGRDRQRSLVGRDMREHPAADRVADRVDVRQRRPQRLVDLHAGGAALDPDLLEPEPLDHGHAAHAEEKAVPGDPGAVREDDRRPAGVQLDSVEARVGDDADPLFLEVAAQKLRQLRLIGDAGPGSRRDQRVAELHRVFAALERALADEPRFAPEERDAVVLGDLVLVEGDAVVDDAPDARHHGGKVDVDGAEANPEFVRGSDVGGDLRGSDQSLRGYAPPGDSGAADKPALEERHAGATRTSGADGGPAAHSRADHGDVVRGARRGRQRHLATRGSTAGS